MAGIVAGPLFLVVWALQAFTRDGFDPGRHPLSLLSLGDLGWIQIANFVATGALFVACAVGLRHRIRVNGLARAVDHRLVIRTEQVYSNCSKYIQERVLTSTAGSVGAGHRTYTGPALTSRQQDWLARTDTFFIASAAAGLGVDASHRGGSPGFVQVIGDRRLAWPDYVGNSMYMTLGNLELNSAAGLLLVDWDRGDTLQLTGRATVDWDPARAATMPGAQRVVDFEIDHVVQVDAATALRWRLVSASPFNPRPARPS
jgi:hypothetical protein